VLNNRIVEDTPENNVLIFGATNKQLNDMLGKVNKTLSDPLLDISANRFINIEMNPSQPFINHYSISKHGIYKVKCSNFYNHNSSYNFKEFVNSKPIHVILFVNGNKNNKQYLIRKSIKENGLFIKYDTNKMTPVSILSYKNDNALISDLHNKTILLFTIAHSTQNNLLNIDIIRHVADMLINTTFADKPNKLRLFNLFQAKNNVGAVLKHEDKNCIANKV